MSTQTQVHRDIKADADVVYALVSDVTRMGEWSPETTSCSWTGESDGPVDGATFRGTNRNGWRRWMTFCRVTAAESGRRFAFEVHVGMPVSTWAYDIEPTETGCRVTETWTDRRPGVWARAARFIEGIDDRGEHNAKGMEVTLARIAAVAEAEAEAS